MAGTLARFGLLYLREGNWQNRQIIPKQWVWVSTTPHTWEEHCGHGYCWDILRRRLSVQGFGKPEVFAATGWGGHIIAVYPEFDMVIVNRTDTYRSEGIDGKQLGRLLLMVLDALQDSALSNPRLIPFEDPTRNFSRISLTPHVGKGYTGEYELADGSTIELREKGKGLVCVFVSPDRGVGTANLLPLSEKSFIIEDFNMPMHFEVNDSGNPVHFIWEVTPDIVWKGRLKKQMKNA